MVQFLVESTECGNLVESKVTERWKVVELGGTSTNFGGI